MNTIEEIQAYYDDWQGFHTERTLMAAVANELNLDPSSIEDGVAPSSLRDPTEAQRYLLRFIMLLQLVIAGPSEERMRKAPLVRRWDIVGTRGEDSLRIVGTVATGIDGERVPTTRSPLFEVSVIDRWALALDGQLYRIRRKDRVRSLRPTKLAEEGALKTLLDGAKRYWGAELIRSPRDVGRDALGSDVHADLDWRILEEDLAYWKARWG